MLGPWSLLRAFKLAWLASHAPPRWHSDGHHPCPASLPCDGKMPPRCPRDAIDADPPSHDASEHAILHLLPPPPLAIRQTSASPQTAPQDQLPLPRKSQTEADPTSGVCAQPFPFIPLVLLLACWLLTASLLAELLIPQKLKFERTQRPSACQADFLRPRLVAAQDSSTLL